MSDIRCPRCGRWVDKPETPEERESRSVRFNQMMDAIEQEHIEADAKRRESRRTWFRRVFGLKASP